MTTKNVAFFGLLALATVFITLPDVMAQEDTTSKSEKTAIEQYSLHNELTRVILDHNIKLVDFDKRFLNAELQYTTAEIQLNKKFDSIDSQIESNECWSMADLSPECESLFDASDNFVEEYGVIYTEYLMDISAIQSDLSEYLDGYEAKLTALKP